MNAKDLKLEEFVTYTDGRIDLKGRRLVLHSINAMGQFRKDLLESLGVDAARHILTRFGYFAGQADAAAMVRLFEWDSLREWLLAGPRLQTMEGAARTVVKSLEIDEEARRLKMEVVWHDSGEAEEHLLASGTAEGPVCWILAGYLSGYATFCLGRNVYFIERRCAGSGSRSCAAEGRDRDSWGEEIEPYVSYFEHSDIAEQVQDLTEELKQKTKEITRQRKRIEALEAATRGPFVEVRSEAFGKVVDLANRVARFDTSVLVTGETGTGKEVIARHIHQESPRSGGPFLAVNCSALPETLLESELFGHKAGSFTGASRDRVGLFEQAGGGTVFLDEIGEVPASMQVKLLRVVQEREIMRVGESTPRKIDVRLIAATNADLDALVTSGQFREDLLYRLRVLEIGVPPLRERREDILSLARHFVQMFSSKLGLPGLRLDAACADDLLGYAWPGNVRELENAIERAAVLSRDGSILPEYLPPAVVRGAALGPGPGSASRTLDEVARDHIVRVLETTNGNKKRAAEVLGVSASTLWRKMKEMGGSSQ